MKPFRVFIVVCGLAIVAAIWATFVHAPVESTMGPIQKIFYFHVSSAFMCYLGFITCALGSLGYLSSRKSKWDVLAFSAAEVGLLFGFIVLITGPIWARPVWGVWWKWEPRLTSMTLLILIFSAYWVLRSFGGTGEGSRRFAAALGVFGAPNIYFIHYAVKKWRGVHPDVVFNEKGGLDPEMKQAWLIVLVAHLLLFALLLFQRYRAHRDERAISALRRRLTRLRTT